MSESILTLAEEKLAEIIWRTAPVASPELVNIAYQELGWKKSTTYTVLRRICDKGIFKNDNAVVTVVLTYGQLQQHQSRQFVASTFSGSLPKFIAAFVGGGKLSSKEAHELVQLIEAHQEVD
ncbi:MAG: BlaI/MecI/CopY family transcriptional regulator [Defluviitaleaceae bacterium]|nr:BlaI/MecI/CopY family transcriptional regulator [Defluviitaleaceae bacterium]